MAEEKVKMKKKTKDVSENIYALNFDFNEDDNLENISFSEDDDIDNGNNNATQITPLEEQDEIEEAEFVLKGYEEQDEPKKKKVLSKIEEGIKSSKRGRGRPRKNPLEKTEKIAKATKKNKKDDESKQKSIKMHTEDNLTEIKLGLNEYKIELQKEEYNIYTEINETSYIIVREPCLRMVSGGNYIFMERQGEEYSVTTNQDFKINYVIDNLERKNNVVNFKLTNLTQIEANPEGLIFEIDEEKVVENNLEDNKTLVISEEDGKVYLPYTKAEVKEDMAQNKGKKISELIEEK